MASLGIVRTANISGEIQLLRLCQLLASLLIEKSSSSISQEYSTPKLNG